MDAGAVAFPPRELKDWYTPLNRPLGTGSYGKIELALDDRAILLKLKQNNDNPLPDIVVESDYFLLQETPSKTLKELLELQYIRNIMAYFAQYSFSAILPSVPTYLLQKDTNIQSKGAFFARATQIQSRYELISELVMFLFDVPLQDVRGMERQLAKRVQVAIKHMFGQEPSKLEKSAKTEVYALAQVSSTTPWYTKTNETIDVYYPVSCFDYIDQPTIVCMEDYFLDKEEYVIVLSYISGEDLLTLLEKESFKKFASCGPRPVPSVFIWYTAWNMLQALQHCHQNRIIHGDVKLENIMFSTSPVLLDFGLACRAGDDDTCDILAGTPDYLAPEVAEQQKRYYTTDIWSLGIVLWEMATGLPYHVPGKTVQEKLSNIRYKNARPDLGYIKPYAMWKYERFVDLLNLMLRRDPVERISVSEALKHIEKTLESFGDPDNPDVIGEWLKNHCCSFIKQPQVRGKKLKKPQSGFLSD